MNNIEGILKNPEKEEFRILNLNKFMFRYWRDLKGIFETIGYKEIDSENEDDFC